MSLKSKKSEQGDATRDALIAVARELFGEQGYAATSLTAIVSQAEVTKGAFYHHFSSKAEIFLHVFEQVKQELSRAAFIIHRDYTDFTGNEEQPAAKLPFKDLTAESNDEVWHTLKQLCRKYIELHTDSKVRRIVLLDARSVLTWDDWRRVENKYGAVILRADLRRAMNRGLIKKLPLTTLATILTGALNEACVLVANAEDHATTYQEAVTIMDHFLEGIRL